MVQGGDNADSQGVVILTAPHESMISANTPGECYSIMRLFKGANTEEESKEEQADFDEIDEGGENDNSRITTAPDSESKFVVQDWSAD